MLVNLDMTIVNLALAKIGDYFHADMNQMQWIISSYLLATAMAFLIFGRLADSLGRRRIFILGVALFTLSSLFAGLTHNLIMLIISRFIQGLGFAATLGLSIVLIVSAFPPAKKGFATGMAITITGFAQAIGPTTGGIILQHLNWHWIFLINVPLGIFSLIMTILFVKKDLINVKKPSFNIYNAFLFLGGIAILLLAINEINLLNWKITLIGILWGILLLIMFIKNCQKNPDSLIDFAIIQNKNYLYAVAIRFIFMVIFASLLFLLPLYLQNILNYSAQNSGIILLTMTALVFVASPITGKILDRFGFIYPVTISLLLAFASLGFMLFFHVSTSMPILITGFMLFGLAIGVHTPSSIYAALNSIAPTQHATAIGWFFTIAMSGSITGVAISSTIMNSFSHRFPVSLQGVANGSVNINHLNLTPMQIYQYRLPAYHTFLQAFHAEIIILMLLILIGFGLCIRLNKASLYRPAPMSATENL